MLEARIEELTKAVQGLTKALEGRTVYALAEVAEGAKLMGDSIKLEVPNASQKSEPTPDTSPPSSPESDAVSYDDVKRITIAVSARDKAKAVAALARFGVTSAKGLKEDQWGEYVAYMQKVASGEVDPEASE